MRLKLGPVHGQLVDEVVRLTGPVRAGLARDGHAYTFGAEAGYRTVPVRVSKKLAAQLEADWKAGRLPTGSFRSALSGALVKVRQGTGPWQVAGGATAQAEFDARERREADRAMGSRLAAARRRHRPGRGGAPTATSRDARRRRAEQLRRDERRQTAALLRGER